MLRRRNDNLNLESPTMVNSNMISCQTCTPKYIINASKRENMGKKEDKKK
jgi:hypothetical protein